MTRPAPSPELIRRCLSGDPRAKGELVEPYLETVLAWTRRLAGPPLDPEDLSHEALLTALDRLHTLRNPADFRSWLYGITRKTVAKYRRRAWYQRWSHSEVETHSDPRSGPGEDAERAERARQCQRILDALTPIQREVLVLVEIEQRTASEAAELLGVGEPTVRSRLRLARAAFIKVAREQGIGPDASTRRKAVGAS
ncbi:MAG TPA: RNA polymerase sigma factor [Myxococcales bacterium LLY-WYZ-16_1]|jgi:RNA polymerase sigma-70 factor, ECF subfamily|nr:RNA polymerase sigma factor [Myxococcales bacterium LLY-WYZ-16_1]